MPSGERCITCGGGIGCVRYGGGAYCSEECAFYELHPENYVEICLNCGLPKGENEDSCSCVGTLSRIVKRTKWEKIKAREKVGMAEPEPKSEKTKRLEQQLEESRRQDREMTRLAREVVSKLTQEEKKLVHIIIHNQLYGDDCG